MMVGGTSAFGTPRGGATSLHAFPVL